MSITPADLARVVEFTEAAAYADMLRAAPASWNCAAERLSAGWLLMAPRLDILLFNRLLACGLDAPLERPDVQAALDRFKGAGLENYGVQLSPAAQPIDAARTLAELGLVARDRWAKVVRGPVAPPAESRDLRIGLTAGADADTAARIACAAFQMPDTLRPWLASLHERPGWRQYLAWDGDEPVATASMFMHDGVGWLGIAGTLPAARRRGAQTALFARRLQDGLVLGCTAFVTETGEDLPERPNPSFHNMRRAGFDLVYLRANYMPVR